MEDFRKDVDIVTDLKMQFLMCLQKEDYVTAYQLQ